MTFIELCQDLQREAGGIAGIITSTVSQTGENLRLVNWIAKAYEAIQNKHVNWEFLRTDLTITGISGTNNYTATSIGLTSFGEWKMDEDDGFRVYLTATGTTDEQPLTIIDWSDFRSVFQIAATRTQTGRPTHIAQKPDHSLILWPIPDAAYTIVGEYYKAPDILDGNSDVPLFPVKYHKMIVWRALMYYAGYESSPALYAEAEREYNDLMAQMEATQLPDMMVAGAMA